MNTWQNLPTKCIATCKLSSHSNLRDTHTIIFEDLFCQCSQASEATKGSSFVGWESRLNWNFPHNGYSYASALSPSQVKHPISCSTQNLAKYCPSCQGENKPKKVTEMHKNVCPFFCEELFPFLCQRPKYNNVSGPPLCGCHLHLWCLEIDEPQFAEKLQVLSCRLW